jgi:hypothetical protein
MSTFSAEHVGDMLDALILACNEEHMFDFDKVEKIIAVELHFCIGLNHVQNQLLGETPSFLEQSHRPKIVLA